MVPEPDPWVFHSYRKLNAFFRGSKKHSHLGLPSSEQGQTHGPFRRGQQSKCVIRACRNAFGHVPLHSGLLLGALRDKDFSSLKDSISSSY